MSPCSGRERHPEVAGVAEDVCRGSFGGGRTLSINHPRISGHCTPPPLPLAARQATASTPTGSTPIYGDSSTHNEAHSCVEASTQAGVEAIEKAAQ